MWGTDGAEVFKIVGDKQAARGGDVNIVTIGAHTTMIERKALRVDRWQLFLGWK
jgi:hypothetical protein